jgi:hypothetical protein
MNHPFLKPLLPHLAVIVGFLLLSIVYNAPMMQGKRLQQNDVIQSKGAAQELAKYRKETGKIALWSNSMFSGMPAFMVSIDYPMSFTTKIGRWIAYAVPEPANMIFLYLTGFYILAIVLGFNLWTASLGAIAYGFASYNMMNIEAGHGSKVLALAFAPPFMAGVVLAYRGKYLVGSALAGLFAGVELYANHVQITYYILMALGLYGIFEFIRVIIQKESLAKFFIATACLALAGALAVGSHASRLLTTYEYTAETIRGKSELITNKQSTSGALDRDYAFGWSYGIGETFTLLVPNFYGGGLGSGAELGKNAATPKLLEENGIDPKYARNFPFYWGAQPFTSGPAYLGAIICFLFVFGLIASKNPIKWWFLAVTILFTMIAWGKNFAGLNYFLFDYFPLFNKFRAHTMTLSAVQLFVACMALLGLQELFKADLDKKALLKKLQISAGTVGGLCLVIAILGGVFQDYRATGKTEIAEAGGKTRLVSNDEAFKQNLVQGLQGNEDLAKRILRAIEDDRASMQSSDAWRSFIFIALATGVLWAFLAWGLPLTYAMGGLILLTLIDLWAVDRRYLNDDNFVKKSQYEAVFEPTEADRQLLQDKSRFRVANFTVDTFNDATTSYNHASVGGYHAAKLRRYQELISAYLGRNNMAVYNMLNTKYFLTGDEQGAITAQKNPEACGVTWFVQEYKTVANADAELKSLEKFNPKKTAFVDKRFASQLKDLKIQPDSSATIRLTSAIPDELTYESNAKTPQLAIFSEIYYVQEGKIAWQAYIDGKPVPHLRADYVLRGLVVPAGKHKIEFKFSSPTYQRGETIALVCSILLLIGVGLAIYFDLRGRLKTTEVV